MHGKVTEPIMKYMVGKHIDKSLRTYIQRNKETGKHEKKDLEHDLKENGNGE
jgi:hypothetical protein